MNKVEVEVEDDESQQRDVVTHCKMIRDKYGVSIGQVYKLILTLSKNEKYYFIIETCNYICVWD